MSCRFFISSAIRFTARSPAAFAACSTLAGREPTKTKELPYFCRASSLLSSRKVTRPIFWTFAMTVFHAGAWWAARFSRVIADITLADSELLLRDLDAKGYLDIELVYRLRQKESLGSVKQKIVRKIQQNESAFCFEDLVRETLEEFTSLP